MIDVARNAAVGKHTLKVSAYDDVTALIDFSFEVTENKEYFLRSERRLRSTTGGSAGGYRSSLEK